MRVLVVTCVHRCDDARVFQREVRSLLQAGHEVVYVAPAVGSIPSLERLEHHSIRRAVGRRRVRAWIDARRMIKRFRQDADVVVVHNLELLPLLIGTGSRPIIWDVHEDSTATLVDKAWIPRWLRAPVSAAVSALERAATRHVSIILAEDAYADHLGDHLVVPNSTPVPERVSTDRDGRTVYVGRISYGRGLATMVEIGRLLGPPGVELIGDVDADAAPALEHAAAQGWVTWLGYIDNETALDRISTASFGLSLLTDLPNYRHSKPTKIHEYLSRGIIAVSTPLPLAVELIRHSGAGVIVSYDDPDAVVQAITELRADPARCARMSTSGHAYAREHLDWNVDAVSFVSEVERVAREGGRRNRF